MDTLKEIYIWTVGNYYGVLISVSMIIVALEGIVRLTPTKKDDTVLERVGKAVHGLMDFLKVPNAKREDGKISFHEPRPKRDNK